MFLTEEEARARRDKKKFGMKEIWYRLLIVTKRREVRRNQKGFWKKKKEKTTSKVKVNESDSATPVSPQPKVIVNSEKVIPDEFILVLFVPRTHHSELAKMIRKDEQAISKLSG